MLEERRIEEAALNSWPALQQIHFDGWLLRFARGYTKRANSVTPLYSSLRSLEEKIGICERIYKEKRLPTIFRLPSFLPGTPELEAALAERRYRHADHTLVLAADLSAHKDPEPNDPAFYEVSLTTWLSIFSQLSQSPIEKHQPHHEILARIVTRPLFAVLRQNKAPVACGLGVLENDTFGLFDIITSSEHREKGHSTHLVTAMLNWAQQNGAATAYLQVVATNQAALRVYQRLGFHELYHYWYRIRPYRA